MIQIWVDELFTSDLILSCMSSFCRRILCKDLYLQSFEWAHFLPCRKAKVKWSWHWQGPICKTGFIGTMVTIDLPCPTYSNKRQLDGFLYEFQISELKTPTAQKERCFEQRTTQHLAEPPVPQSLKHSFLLRGFVDVLLQTNVRPKVWDIFAQLPRRSIGKLPSSLSV